MGRFAMNDFFQSDITLLIFSEHAERKGNSFKRFRSYFLGKLSDEKMPSRGITDICQSYCSAPGNLFIFGIEITCNGIDAAPFILKPDDRPFGFAEFHMRKGRRIEKDDTKKCKKILY